MSRVLQRERPLDLLLLLAVLFGLQQLGSAAMIHAKAQLAPLLIASAWSRTLAQGGAPQRPWPWADTWPVGRLQAPGYTKALYILAGDSGNALAFGPGHARASAALGSNGMAVVGGHRDTHFAFLGELQDGDLLRLQLPSREWRRYRVVLTEVVNSQRHQLQAGQEGERLLLVTCYPFDALTSGGPLRYVVQAVPESSHLRLLAAL